MASSKYFFYKISALPLAESQTAASL